MRQRQITGHVQRAGNAWQARVPIGRYPNGSTKYRTETHRTRAEADAARSRLLATTRTAHSVSSRPTVAEWLDVWLAQSERDPQIQESTRAARRHAVLLHLRPRLSHLYLDEIRKTHVTDLIADLLAGRGVPHRRKLSPNTVRGVRSTLKLALDAAIPEHLTHNPTTGATKIRKPRTTRRAMRQPEIEKLLAFCSETSEWATEARWIEILISTGLREGELLGLSWDDLNLDDQRPTITIRRSLKRIHKAHPGDDGRRCWVELGSTKTPAAERSFRLSKSAIDAFRRIRDAQDLARAAFERPATNGERPTFGGSWSTERLVATTSVGTPIDPRNFARRVTAAITAAGLGRWIPHELRHTFGQRLYDRRVPLEQISALMGHSSPRVTWDVYCHPAEDFADGYVDVIDAA